MTDFIAYRLPEGSRIAALGDQSVFIRAALEEVQSAAAVGGLLAVLILYLFLRSGYSTLIIALAIPLSIAVTFAPLLAFGVTLNIMSLGGLALGVGMLVDNSVVVLESIFRCREEGDDVVTSAVRGTQEVGGAVIASTLTTVAVFFPIVFVEGVAGQVFGDLALAVVCSLLASLFVALFVVPMLASRNFALPDTAGDVVDPETPRRPWVALRALPRWWARRRQGWGARLLMPIVLPYALLQTVFELLGNLIVALAFAIGGPVVLVFRLLRKVVALLFWPAARAVELGMDGLKAVYRRVLAVSLRAPLLVMLALAGLGVVAWLAASRLGAELIPDVRQGVLVAEVTLPVGTPLDETARRIARLEQALASSPLIERVEAFIGEPEQGEDDAGERGPHTAALTVQLTAGDDPVAHEAAAMAVIRRAVGEMPDATLELSRPALFSLRAPIRVVILGQNLPLLGTASARVEAAMAALPSLSDVQSSVRPGYPELQIRFDRLRLAAMGLDPRSVAEQLRARIDGEVATELRGQEQPIDVRVRLDPTRVDSRAELAAMVINPGGEIPIPLEAVAEIITGEGPAEIRRVDGQRAAVLTAQVGAFDLAGASRGIDAALDRVALPAGFDTRLQGQDEEMERSLQSLGFALLLAIFLVYVVMASQFESLRAPLVIMGSLPLAAIGVLLVLGVVRLSLSVVVFVGLITLAGIVVNNAIVLVDYARQLRRRGLGVDEALIEAGLARLRPILMTTLTTVLGLVPLALDTGDGAELRRPIAITLIAGLVFSTGLTLVVIPVLYRWVVGERIDRGGEDAPAGEPVTSAPA
ncbi:MAG: efflux RND transporter permease subunit [Myxococcales bacterium]|nr:efflux RND transporter permease subunit [Myxococcales bacterium]